MLVKNNSHTLFRWQEFYWRPGETLDLGTWPWEERLAYELTQKFKNLEIVKPATPEEEKKQKMIERMAKARAARKAKNASSA